jgi:rod shape-determining protein MreC
MQRMEPPTTRRSGYSRRAQYTTFFGYIAGVLGALVGAGLLIASTINPGVFSGLRGAAASSIEPAGEAAAEARAGGRNLLDVIDGFIFAGSRNARLQRQLDQAKIRLVEADAVADENRRLKALLGLAKQDPKPVAVARLTASSAFSARRFATLSAGSSDGVAPGMPVRSPLGLIGRVLEVGPGVSRVLLVTDTQSVVPVRRARDGLAAFAQGHGDGTLRLRLINLGINRLRKGDVFVTSGTGGLYRPGTPVAMITALTTDGGVARVLSDPAATDFVIIDPIWSSPPAGLEAPPPEGRAIP